MIELGPKEAEVLHELWALARFVPYAAGFMALNLFTASFVRWRKNREWKKKLEDSEYIGEKTREIIVKKDAAIEYYKTKALELEEQNRQMREVIRAGSKEAHLIERILGDVNFEKLKVVTKRRAKG